jgi:glycosyltransferase involved in cell wall biosynthesis
VWTVHNLYEHEGQHHALEQRLRRWLARHCAALIVHGPSAAESVRREYLVPERTEIALVPHGHYLDAYPAPRDRRAARAHLGLQLDAPTLLFLGQIRRYKGVPALIDAFARAGPGLQLVVAGRPHPPELGDELRARARDVAGVRLRLEYVPDDEVAAYVAACDLFVLPHEESLTSGSAVLAMSFGRACIAPRIGCFVELLGDEGGFLYESHDGLAGALRSALAQRQRWDEMGTRNRATIERSGWEQVAAETAAVYARALRSPVPA